MTRRDALPWGTNDALRKPKTQVRRVYHPEWGAIRPDRFLPLAERNGLIAPIGRWVLRRACADLSHWRQLGITGVRVAVNLSPYQFLDKGLTREVVLTLDEYGLCAQDIELEITESAAVPHLDHSIRRLRELRKLGVKVSIDDFGTGFSSLCQLKCLPVSGLKLDQGFVRDLPGNPMDTAITATVIRLAKLLGLDLVAEGVEHAEQLTALRQEGCQSVQGFLLARPQPADRLLPLLLGGSSLVAAV